MGICYFYAAIKEIDILMIVIEYVWIEVFIGMIASIIDTKLRR